MGPGERALGSAGSVAAGIRPFEAAAAADCGGLARTTPRPHGRILKWLGVRCGALRHVLGASLARCHRATLGDLLRLFADIHCSGKEMDRAG